MARRKRKTLLVRHKQSLGFGWLLLLLVAGLPIAVFLAWKEPPPVPREARSRSSADAETMSGTNVHEEPAPESAPAPKAEVQSTPPAQPIPVAPSPTPEVPQPEALPASTVESPQPPQMLDWAEIATRPARWPAQTQLKAAVDFPIFVGSKRSGSTRISAGTRVKVVKISEAGVDISFGEFTTMVALDQTTLGEQMIEAQSDSKTSPQAAEH